MLGEFAAARLARPMRSPSRTSGQAATRTRRSPGCGARGRCPPATPRHPRRRPGLVEDTAAWLARNVADGDAVLVMGGGKSYRIAELLLEALEAAG